MNRRTFLGASLGGLLTLGTPASPLVSDALAFGERDRLRLGLLKYTGPNWNPRPGALRRLLLEVEKRTSILVNPSEGAIPMQGPGMFDYPLIVLAGDRAFDPWPTHTVELLRKHLNAGGLLFVDSSEAVRNGAFLRSVRRELARVFPGTTPAPIGKAHVLYKSFYLIQHPYGRVKISPHMLGISQNDRLKVVISENDLMGAWARDNFGAWEYEVVGGAKQRDMAFRLGINLVMYAMCVNYKSDQVHIPFILKRRKWRVK